VEHAAAQPATHCWLDAAAKGGRRRRA
jgi:hypothetical protein